MIHCTNCGEQMQDEAKFCPSCGQAAGQDAANGQGQSTQQQPLSQEKDAQDNKGMAVLAYILFFVPLLTGAHKTSPFVKYHTNQGTVLFLAAVAFGVAYGILISIFTAIFFAIGAWGLFSIITTLLGLCWLLVAALCVIGIVNAVNGKMKPLPVIGKFTIVK